MPIDEKRTERRLVAGILIFAFLIRAAYVMCVNVLPWNDMMLWDGARRSLAYGTPYTAYWTPLFPAFLALLTRIFGENYKVFNLFNALFSALTCLYIYLCAREAFGRKTAYIALGAAALYTDMIWYCGVMLSETPGMFLISALAYHVVKDGNAAVSGLLFGLLCWERGLFLIALPAFVIWLWYRNRTGAWFKKTALFCACFAAVVLPWSLRNYRVYNTFILEPHWVYSMAGGHNAHSDGGYNTEVAGEVAKAEHGEIDAAALRRDMFKGSFVFALHNPVREVQLVFLKASKQFVFTTSFPFYRLGDYPGKKAFFAAAFLENLVFFPLCVLGLVFAFRDRNGLGFSLIVLAFAGAFITLFDSDVRKRMPFVPFMLVLAAYGAVKVPEIMAAFREGKAGAMSGRLATAGLISGAMIANSLVKTATRLQDVLQRFQ
jgi:4-amino-4-deoxy-L-arabinose transferase-like glycosyltransferase